jgi:hypothetical protein
MTARPCLLALGAVVLATTARAESPPSNQSSGKPGYRRDNGRIPETGPKVNAARLAKLRADFYRAAAEPDPARRAEAVLPFLDRVDGPAYGEVLDVLAACGKPAVSLLRQVVADEDRPGHYDLLGALVRAAGDDAAAELEALLREERTYWDNLGLNLDDPVKVARPRFQFLVEILTHLRELGYRDEGGLVRAVRDRFGDHPILCDYGKELEQGTPVGPSPVVRAADSILSRK